MLSAVQLRCAYLPLPKNSPCGKSVQKRLDFDEIDVRGPTLWREICDRSDA